MSRVFAVLIFQFLGIMYFGVIWHELVAGQTNVSKVGRASECCAMGLCDV